MSEFDFIEAFARELRNPTDPYAPENKHIRWRLTHGLGSARHLAGHAVAAWAAGADLRGAAFKLDDAPAEHTLCRGFYRAFLWPHGLDGRGVAVGNAAGLFAQEFAVRQAGFVDVEGRQEVAARSIRDLADLNKACRAAGVTPEEAWAAAAQLVTAHWEHVEVISEELLRHGQINGKDVNRALAGLPFLPAAADAKSAEFWPGQFVAVRMLDTWRGGS